MPSTDTFPKVDFIGIGFPRSGTTWLSQCLAEHPDICFSKLKEVHFFDHDYMYERGGAHYAKYFDCTEGQVVGEFTPEYIRAPEKCAERIHSQYPDTKLLVVLRDPVLRAFSHYRYRKYKSGAYEHFAELIEHKDTDPIIKESKYINSLRPFLEYFDEGNILFLVQEESLIDPAAYLKKVYDFLEVDDLYQASSLLQKVNISDNQGSRFVWFEHWVGGLRWKLRATKLGRAVLILSKWTGITGLVTWLRGVNRVPVKNPERVTREEYETLWKHFEPSVYELEQTIGVDLHAYWGTYRGPDTSAQRA